ncbi:MAG: PQQ-binding-like beta-propeller repeat protein, partial [Xanthomonas sp.]
MQKWRAVGTGVVLALLAGAGAAAEGDWAHYGGAPGGGQYSPLTQITPDNIGRLRVAWSFHTGEKGQGLPDPDRVRFEANPLVIDGRMYLTTGTDIVFALDAATGAKLWSFDPRIARDKHYSDPASRGVTFWRDPQAAAGAACATRIVVGTLDARLIALDAADGRPCAGFGDGGTIDLHVGIDSLDAPQAPWRNYAVTSPPVIAGEVLVSGSSIGDNRAHHEEQGVVRGYDVRSGRALWRWDPVPRHPDDPRASAWQADQAATVGAANAWPPLSVDPALGLVYVPTGSASPDYYGGQRLGDNRDANSLVALEARTGRRVWAQQLVHHDLWDYDLASQPALATVQTAQGPREAVLQATKTGFLFAFDRRTGAPVFPISEVPVPASDVPGEQASPTQPMPEPALRLARHAPVTAADAWGATPGAKAACA